MTDFTVYFKKPVNWADNLHIHYWGTPLGTSGTAWPGILLTANGNGWFVYRFNGIAAARLVFHDGCGQQTGDLQRERTGGMTSTAGGPLTLPSLRHRPLRRRQSQSRSQGHGFRSKIGRRRFRARIFARRPSIS